MKQTFLFLLIGFTGLLCRPLEHEPKITEQERKEPNEKKGTIRIAGPWHSESALDRNVDPAEDTYVKKIISSNEGINFNKDMAEAGEVFDVNGIEDFYDKNAMITYEVNGHEIPVHLKPKYTPQSKAMFPEYMRENPAAMGLTRQTKQHDKSQPANQHYSNRMTSFSGFTDKDMPEYKVHDSPVVKGGSDGYNEEKSVQKFINTHGLPNAKIIENGGKLPWQTVDSSGHLNIEHAVDAHNDGGVKLIDQTHRVSEDDLAKPKYFHSHSNNGNEYLNEHHYNEANLKDYSNNHEHFASSNIDNTKPDTSHQTNYENKHFFKSSPRNEDIHNDVSDVNKNARILQYHRKHSDRTEDEHSQHIENEDQKSASESEHSDALFSKLEQLHKSLDKSTDMLAHQSDNSHEQAGSNEESKSTEAEPEKVKAKARILSLLGELSDKLKGMEAVVTGKHHDKNIESFQQDPSSSESANFHKDSSSSESDLLKAHHEIDNAKEDTEEVKPSRMEQFMKSKETFHDQGAAEVSHPHVSSSIAESSESESPKHYTQNAINVEQHDDESRLLEKHADDESRLLEQHADDESRLLKQRKPSHFERNDEKGYDIQSQVIADNKRFHENENKIYEDRYSEDEHSAVKSNYDHAPSNKLLPDTIEKYQEENKPFIMNTASIDYHPENDEVSEDKNVDGRGQKTLYRGMWKSRGDEKKYEDKEEENKDDAESYHRHHHHHEERQENMKHKHKFFHPPEDRKAEEEKEEESEGKTKTDEETPDTKTADESKTEEVAESLADADDAGILRERTFRPKTNVKTEDIEYPDYNEVKDAAVFETNFLRKKYHADKINWSDKLSDKAQQNAEKLARRADLDVTNLDSFKQPGENIALVKFNSPNVGKEATDFWAREGKNYDFRSPLVTKKNTDFVQLMWKTNKEFGMGVAKSKTGKGWIVTSYFDTPYIDRFQDLRLNLQSDIPIKDPYGDIVGR